MACTSLPSAVSVKRIPRMMVIVAVVVVAMLTVQEGQSFDVFCASIISRHGSSHHLQQHHSCTLSNSSYRQTARVLRGGHLATGQYHHHYQPPLMMQAGDASSSSSEVEARNGDDAKKGVVVVGGGPAGLASAIMLAQRGWTDITVLEKSRSADYYEPDRAFVYQIDGRGQKFTDMVGGMTDVLASRSVPNTEFLVQRLTAKEGISKPIALPIVDPSRKTAYWIPRHMFTRMLTEHINSKWAGHINILYEVEFSQLIKDTAGRLTVVAKQATADGSLRNEAKKEIDPRKDGDTSNSNSSSAWQYLKSVEFSPQLVVGADGMNSKVRETLKEWEADRLAGQEGRGGAQTKAKENRFGLKKVKTGSSGLLYKIFPLKPDFPLDRSLEVRSKPEMAYVVVGSSKDRKTRLRMGVLPSSDPEGLRSMNAICPPDHKIWTLKSGPELSEYLQTACPHLPMDVLVPPAEADRFATTKRSMFIEPQCCTGMHFLVAPEQGGGKPPNALAAQAGVVLVGDVVHAFPPDLGQGVNSALEDVVVLDRFLTESGDNLAVALPLFENKRKPDSQAILQLMRLGFPWQYGQSFFKTRLWTLNFASRLLLNKCLPSFFSPQIFMCVQKEWMSYSDILRAVHRTTRNIFLSVAFISSTLYWLYASRGGPGAAIAGAVAGAAGVIAGMNELWRRSVPT